MKSLRIQHILMKEMMFFLMMMLLIKYIQFTAFGWEIELIIMKGHIKDCKMLFQVLEDFINLLFFQQFL